MQKKAPMLQGAHSVPHRDSFVVALLFAGTYYLLLIGVFAALFAFFAAPMLQTGLMLVTLVGLAFILWVLGLLKRRKARCPLCRCTPFLDSSAHYHVKATRFFPLNHGTSNLIRGMFCQSFRCQYCGTPFDLLRPVAGRSNGTPNKRG